MLFWGFDHDVHVIDKQRGTRLSRLQCNTEDDFGDTQARQLNAIADHYRDQGLVVWVWMISSDNESREVTQRIARFGDSSHFVLGVVPDSQFRDFFGWNTAAGLQPHLPSLAQIDRTGQIQHLNSLLSDEIERQIDLFRFAGEIDHGFAENTSGPSIPLPLDFYRIARAGAREISAAEWISKIRGLNVAREL